MRRSALLRRDLEKLARLLAALLLGGCAAVPSLIDADPASGFALYRSGHFNERSLAALCAAGVEELVVLDGTAAERECRWRARVCPDLRVRYDQRQSARRPLSVEFLAAFDTWVEEARSQGRKVAFRCRHGWHRAGRLAAYYRLRFQGREAGAAVEEMERRGRFMWRHRQLGRQVLALDDRLRGRPCGTDPADCPRSEPAPPGVAVGRFAADVCPAAPEAPAS